MSSFERAIRLAGEDDLSFIADSWMKSFCHLMEPYGINRNWLTFAQRSLIDWILQRCTVLVACNKADPNHIYAYACFSVAKDTLLIHWGYTKNHFRGDGMFSELIASAKERAGGINDALFTFSINHGFDKAICHKFGIRCRTGSLNWINVR